MLTFTLLVIGVTVAVSLLAFSNQKLMNGLIFHGPSVKRGGLHRLLTYGFVHGDMAHLAFNMIAFWSFGGVLENHLFADLFGGQAFLFTAILYLVALVVSILPDYFQHKNDPYYRSLGASGAVSAVVFASILLMPTLPVSIIFIPIAIPGWIFGILFIVVSAYLDRRGGGRINHGAHIAGALFGVLFTWLAASLFGDFDVAANFIRQIKG